MHGRGGHQNAELLILEMLDENNKPLSPGEPGEVTITTLGVEAMPLLRYKTGDICVLHDEPCPCGRNSVRLSPVVGRRKQMIKFKGTTLYPPALFDLLNEMQEVKDYVIEVQSNELGIDEVILHLLPSNQAEESDHKIRAYLQARLRVSPHVRYVSREDLQRMQFPETSRKPIRFIDRRS
jgi:phenylacetate-CoA ligase